MDVAPVEAMFVTRTELIFGQQESNVKAFAAVFRSSCLPWIVLTIGPVWEFVDVPEEASLPLMAESDTQEVPMAVVWPRRET
jgi:ABC-type dipeptide/oligopeptide/nickel transport system permease component